MIEALKIILVFAGLLAYCMAAGFVLWVSVRALYSLWSGVLGRRNPWR